MMDGGVCSVTPVGSLQKTLRMVSHPANWWLIAPPSVPPAKPLLAFRPFNRQSRCVLKNDSPSIRSLFICFLPPSLPQ
ncbi:hypothetical protein AYI68_g5811 [Smittium mucronatum]|uniref:Uncharacterized protein n=1 Tax=Smittium mucronatum TaxID=133383 RepID=A0A1R0GT93_9FUNG|nr:hypothetical protein AYI68_g5811 [Smittium mucronatum]